ncbi:MAG TPA: hypothetical protein VF695_16965, partial [Sphingomonas sp.]
KATVVEVWSGYPLDCDTGIAIEEAHDDPPFHLREDGFNCIGSTMIAGWVTILQAWEGDHWNLTRRTDLEGLSPKGAQG